jgi:ADP-heptose:LPS heptosyltransferase
LLNEIQSAARRAAVVSWAPGPLGQLVSALGRASMAIGNDTGPLHIAAALGVKSVGLFGPTSGARNGPYGPAGAFIQSRTGRVADIPVAEVFEAIARARDRAPGPLPTSVKR